MKKDLLSNDIAKSLRKMNEEKQIHLEKYLLSRHMSKNEYPIDLALHIDGVQ